jgi:hypothetical protein
MPYYWAFRGFSDFSLERITPDIKFIDMCIVVSIELTGTKL